MRKIRNIRKDDAVSPVIATILMVAITVVLAAVLYVMVMGMTQGPGQVQTPLGLNQKSKTTTTVTIGVSSAPTAAKVSGTSISFTHEGTPTAITNATVYDAAANQVAWYESGTWTYASGYTADTLSWSAGMTIVITAGSISLGDQIDISSSSNTFGPSSLTVS